MKSMLKRFKEKSIHEKYKLIKRLFFIQGIVFFILLSSFGVYFFLNYDYFVLKHMISQYYIYTDTLDELYSKELKRDIHGNYYKYFDNVVASVLSREIRGINNDKYTYLYLPERLQRSRESEKNEANETFYKIINDRILYIKLTNFSKYTEAFFKENLSTFSSHPYLILDLRDNPGGWIDSQYFIADLFLPQKTVIARDITRSIFFTKTIKSRKKPVFDFSKIIILQNENSASSSEGLISALKDNLENVTLIGTTTFGKGIGQTTIPMKNGFAMKATTMFWNTPNNKNIQGLGIPADIEYTDEDIINFAVTYLK